MNRRPTLFWLVWDPAGRSPTMRHPNRDVAVREAERLAAANPGREFYACPAVSCSRKSIAVTEVFHAQDDDIPF